MCRYLKIYILIVVCLCQCLTSFANDIELSIQTGHTDHILLVSASPDGRFIATYGQDQKVIVWETRTASQFTYTKMDSTVVAITFTENNQSLIIYSHEITYWLDLASGICTDTSIVNTENHFKYVDEYRSIQLSSKNHGGVLNINLYKDAKFDRFTSDYSDEPFTNFVYSIKNNSCYVACSDGNIYVFDSTFKSKKYFKGHLGSVNSLALSPDEKYLYSASDDRTVIQWNLYNGEIEKRFYGKCYATHAISITPNGHYLTFGNEVGQVKQIHLDQYPLDIIQCGMISGCVNFTYASGSDQITYGGYDNQIYITGTKNKNSYNVSGISYGLLSYNLVTKLLNLYKPPFAQMKSGSVNPAGKFLVYSGATTKKFSNYYRIIDLETGKRSDAFFATEVSDLNKILFLNDSVFFNLDCDSLWNKKRSRTDKKYNSISFWMITNNDYESLYHDEISLDGYYKSAVKLNSEMLAILDIDQKLFTYSILKQELNATNHVKLNNVFSLHENLIASSDALNNIQVYKYQNDSLCQIATLVGHQDKITECIFDPTKNHVISTSEDATVRIWSLDSAALLVTIIPIGGTNAIYVTPDNYYFSTSRNLNSFGFKVGMDYYYPEQFDLIYNRPDIVLTQLGYEDEELISAYKLAHEKRLQKLGYSSDSLQSDFHLPEIKIDNLSSLPHSLNNDSLILKITAYDQLLKLDRLQVWVNDVAIYGAQGISVRSLDTNLFHTDLTIPLALGGNKIQVSVLNTGGAESFRSGVFVECTSGKSQSDLYVVSIGCSKFIDNKYDLNYASKDALDFVSLFNNQKLYHTVNSKTLTDEQVTKENVIQLREFLASATINDVVMVFFAGHGVLDNNLNYYLAGHDMDFSQPEKRGIPYTDIESLVDGIAPLKKLVFIDACHSGELDKSEVILSDEKSVTEAGDISFRKVGNQLSQLHGISSSELSKSLFADLRKGTGATVISSASGVEFAMESDQWQNGLFTYCLIRGLTKGFADLDHNKEITVSELQLYVQDEVNRLSNGKQTPTSRMENNALNYRIW